MNRLKNIFLIGITFISFGCVAQDSYILSKDYAVKILGTSNLHNWDETVSTVGGYGVVSWNSNGSFNLDAIHITMDANSIKSESSIMTNKTLSALKAGANPEITFTLEAAVKSITASAEGTTISAKGNLTIAGVTKAVTMQVKIFSPEKGILEIQGSQVINMPDYNISPPTALFGTLKTGDTITLDFKTTFTKSNS